MKLVNRFQVQEEVEMDILYDSDGIPYICISIMRGAFGNDYHVTTKSLVDFISRNFGGSLMVLKEPKDGVKSGE